MHRVPISKSVRFEVFLRDGFTCRYCGRSAPHVTLEIDHRTPVAKGGTNELDNLLTACRACNSGKSVMEIEASPAQHRPRPARTPAPWEDHLKPGEDAELEELRDAMWRLELRRRALAQRERTMMRRAIRRMRRASGKE